MAEYQRIEYTIDRNGKITERVLGGQGTNCLATTAAIEADLGTVTHRELLPEYYENSELLTVDTPLEQHT
ncbi:MAG TPA: hypothetical protein DCQ32_01555 [Cyanobacteria bacterium UBA8156]|jgi:hypothetical protein|nr:hypothetical protein [Cyanobacteria bacterium UBA8156]